MTMTNLIIISSTMENGGMGKSFFTPDNSLLAALVLTWIIDSPPPPPAPPVPVSWWGMEPPGPGTMRISSKTRRSTIIKAKDGRTNGYQQFINVKNLISRILSLRTYFFLRCFSFIMLFLVVLGVIIPKNHMDTIIVSLKISACFK